jgi:HEAT repeat protein
MPPLGVTAPSLAPVALRLDQVRAELAAMGGRSKQDTTSIAVPPLMAALKDSDVEVRRAAAQSLANLEDVRAVPAFIEATRDTDAEVGHSGMALGSGDAAPSRP